MKALIQRVAHASVTVDCDVVGRIGVGLLVLLGVEAGDDEAIMRRLADKVLKYRVFPDEAGKMNRSVTDIGGGLLVVSQFTLAADTAKGLRPGFDTAMPPAQAEALYEGFVAHARQTAGVDVQTGRFGAKMAVALLNDGPVTFLLECR